MKKFYIGLFSGLLIGLLLAGGAITYADSPIRLLINGKYIQCDVQPQIINGRTMVPARFVAEALGATVSWDEVNQTVVINGAGYVAPTTTTTQTTPQASDVITKSNLPYTINAKNGMSLTINSYTASTQGVKFNITMKNNSSVSNKGDIMTSTWDVYDGKTTLKFLIQDQTFWDIGDLHSGQSVTGNIAFEGLTNNSGVITLEGGLWQYIDNDPFEIKFAI